MRQEVLRRPTFDTGAGGHKPAPRGSLRLHGGPSRPSVPPASGASAPFVRSLRELRAQGALEASGGGRYRLLSRSILGQLAAAARSGERQG